MRQRASSVLVSRSPGIVRDTPGVFERFLRWQISNKYARKSVKDPINGRAMCAYCFELVNCQLLKNFLALLFLLFFIETFIFRYTFPFSIRVTEVSALQNIVLRGSFIPVFTRAAFFCFATFRIYIWSPFRFPYRSSVLSKTYARLIAESRYFIDCSLYVRMQSMARSRASPL